jgi:hypothetical protein
MVLRHATTIVACHIIQVLGPIGIQLTQTICPLVASAGGSSIRAVKVVEIACRDIIVSGGEQSRYPKWEQSGRRCATMVHVRDTDDHFTDKDLQTKKSRALVPPGHLCSALGERPQIR